MAKAPAATAPAAPAKKELKIATKEDMISVLREHCAPDEFKFPRGTEDRKEQTVKKIRDVMAKYGYELEQSDNTVFQYFSNGKADMGWEVQSRGKKTLKNGATLYQTKQTLTMESALERAFSAADFATKEFGSLEKAGEFFQLLERVMVEAGGDIDEFREVLYKVAKVKNDVKAAELLKAKPVEQLKPDQAHLETAMAVNVAAETE